MKLIYTILNFILICGSAQSVIAKETTSNKRVALQQYSWHGELPKQRVVKVFNPFGSISSSNTNHNMIEIGGVIQQIGSIKKPYDVEISDVDGITEIHVVYPEGIKSLSGERIARFDLGIYVPANVTLLMETDFGDIKVKKHRSHLIAYSKSGKIKLGTAGSVQARSESGNIYVDLYAKNWFQTQNISSEKGDVYLSIVNDANVELKLSASDIHSNKLVDYPNIKVNYKNFHGSEHNKVSVVFGRAAQTFNVHTQLGSINLNVLEKPSFNKSAGIARFKTRTYSQ
ncbi:hypothetical protein [Pseudoalteromonas denitrificans]|uniref:Adhesin domain-containing protein n=1 Tax=Pseudoalteromonas denitrificans DSM 6059 TaxID=1123010 RepID=A0A1I1RC17_9GAMM|nr:hypothetical protein [Pseudoalteromonas denitrificans]SFD31926.1 hypothetical protein SAMN02745724_04190 [Pseudoalteromonas denitrificans DSM 6059]